MGVVSSSARASTEGDRGGVVSSSPGASTEGDRVGVVECPGAILEREHSKREREREREENGDSRVDMICPSCKSANEDKTHIINIVLCF